MLPHITAAIIDNWKSFHMLKRLCLAFAGLFALMTVAQGAGTVPGFSLTPQFDLTGAAAPGCKLYVYQAGTVATPQNAYSDSGLTQLLPNPLTCDAGARLPQFFVADGTIKIRLTKSNGTQIFVGDNLTVVGASSGGGGGGTVDPTTIAATGDMKSAYGTAILSGWVRANGRTIGSSTSGATERANSDCQALFEYLWGADANLSVSGGRGASAAADWAANKTIALPDLRGRVIAGIGDMGNSDAGRLTASYFGGNPGTLGATGGTESHTLTVAEMPSHNHGVTDPGHHHDFRLGSNTAFGSLALAGSVDNNTETTANSTTGISIQNTGGGAAHATVQPTILMNIYIKL